jgi:hypothetical protein
MDFINNIKIKIKNFFNKRRHGRFEMLNRSNQKGTLKGSWREHLSSSNIGDFELIKKYWKLNEKNKTLKWTKVIRKTKSRSCTHETKTNRKILNHFKQFKKLK